MRFSVTSFLILSLVAIASTSPAQPKEGDLLVSCLVGTPTGRAGRTIVLDPGTKAWTTLATSPVPYHHEIVRMDSNNKDVVFGAVDATSTVPSNLILLSQGRQTTLGVFPGAMCGSELDHDGWVLTGFSRSSGYLWGLSRNQVTTFVKSPNPAFYNEVLIDREPGASKYVIAIAQNNMTIVNPRLLAANRKGTVTTIYAGMGAPLEGLMALELVNKSGDYLTCGGLGVSACTVSRVTKKGGVSILQSTIPATNGMRFNQDGTAWVLSQHNMNASLYKIDDSGKVITIIPVTGFNTAGATGIEVYGSRKLVCNQQGKTVSIRLSSRRPGDANQQYVLACSFNRRPSWSPCLQFPNGEYLFLDSQDVLFFLTTQNLLPSIFGNFRGTTDGSGNANATVAIPSGLSGTGVTIFVAGAIFSVQHGVHTVTNTHWFVL